MLVHFLNILISLSLYGQIRQCSAKRHAHHGEANARRSHARPGQSSCLFSIDSCSLSQVRARAETLRREVTTKDTNEY